LGKVEEKIGDLTGLDSWKTSGQKRQAEGNVEHKQAQTQGYTEGTKDRVAGTFDKVTGSVTGDTSKEVSGRFFGFPRPFRSLNFHPGDAQKEKGKVQQDVNSS
jgi:uncharacterized protein YjbJ (UPF0337 family)